MSSLEPHCGVAALATELLELALERSGMHTWWLGRKGQDETEPSWPVVSARAGGWGYPLP